MRLGPWLLILVFGSACGEGHAQILDVPLEIAEARCPKVAACCSDETVEACIDYTRDAYHDALEFLAQHELAGHLRVDRAQVDRCLAAIAAADCRTVVPFRAYPWLETMPEERRASKSRTSIWTSRTWWRHEQAFQG